MESHAAGARLAGDFGELHRTRPHGGLLLVPRHHRNVRTPAWRAPALLLIAGCAAANPATGPVQAGRIESTQVTEASGLARSTLRGDRFWVVNDGGSPPLLHAIGSDGRDEGRLRLEPAKNLDWESVASFELDGKHWLLVADTGDNDAVREHSTIYVVAEPPLHEREDAVAPPAWTIEFRWPDGPRDCEAVAVDSDGERILLLSKRSIPAELYELPIRPGLGGAVTAIRLGAVDSLPQPTARDRESAPVELDWHWQPTAMDISPDGSSAVILTYRAVYHFERTGGEPWIAALRKPPSMIALEFEAEAVAFVEDGSSVIVTVESPFAPLYQVPLLRE